MRDLLDTSMDTASGSNTGFLVYRLVNHGLLTMLACYSSCFTIAVTAAHHALDDGLVGPTQNLGGTECRASGHQNGHGGLFSGSVCSCPAWGLRGL